MPLYLVGFALEVILAVHAARTGRMYPWLWIIVFVPGIGSLIYIIVELGPELLHGRTGRRVQSQVVKTIDPGRVYRALARQVEIAPTVHNKIRLAEECLRLGRADEAVSLYEESATGLHANEPGLRMSLARARFAAGDYTGALHELDRLKHDAPDYRSAEGHLLYARALDAVGRTEEALSEYAALIAYYPGEEARCRYADLLTRTGATDRAREQYREVVRRTDLQGRGYRRLQQLWYDAARKAA